MNVDDLVAARIEAARLKIQNDKRRRAELAEARKHGIAQRHAQKLRNLRDRETRQQERADQSVPDTRARERRDDHGVAE